MWRQDRYRRLLSNAAPLLACDGQRRALPEPPINSAALSARLASRRIRLGSSPRGATRPPTCAFGTPLPRTPPRSSASTSLPKTVSQAASSVRGARIIMCLPSQRTAAASPHATEPAEHIATPSLFHLFPLHSCDVILARRGTARHRLRGQPAHPDHLRHRHGRQSHADHSALRRLQRRPATGLCCRCPHPHPVLSFRCCCTCVLSCSPSSSEDAPPSIPSVSAPFCRSTGSAGTPTSPTG